MADFKQHEPCPSCGSKDNLARYEDGSAYCFGCEHHEHASGAATPSVKRKQSNWSPIHGDYHDLPDRKLYAKTLKKFGYQLGHMGDGTPCHIAPLYGPDRSLVAQKIRLPNKDFRVLGSLDNATLFGENLWDHGGKRLVVTEGELDAMSYAQASGLTWPVVSVPNGAQSAVKAIKRSLTFVESFDEVVFLFDMDDAGQDAARDCAELLPAGKARIGRMDRKDANELLIHGEVVELKKAVYDAKTHRPDGVFSGSDIDLTMLRTVTPKGLSLPYKGLSDAMHGIRKRELVMLCAGSGIGKTTLAREIGYHLTITHGQRMGWIMLEESMAKSAQSLIALDNGVPVGNLMENPDQLTDSQWAKSYESVVTKGVFYDAWGSTDVDNIIAKMRYLAVGAECDFIVLDHVSMVVSGLDVDERKTLDMLMTRIRSEVCEQTGVGVIAISHLKRNGNKESFNEGGNVSITDLRGSAAIEQLSDFVIAAERNQQSETDPYSTKLRILKNRPFGTVGPAGLCSYRPDTGRLVHIDGAEPQAAPKKADAGPSPFTF